MIKVLKAKKSDLETNTLNVLEAAEANGFIGFYDAEESTCQLTFRGIDINLVIGSENLYFKFESFTKDCPADTMKAIATLMNFVANY